MAIMLDGTTRVIIQGITGKAGSYHALEMRRQGTNVVAGVSPGRGGEKIDGIPVFDTVQEAVDAFRPDLSLVLVPARFAKDAALEAMAAGVKTVVVVAEGVPVHDSLELTAKARQYGCRVVGPNTPGIFSPGKAKAGIMPTNAFKPGHVGIVSRSGTLSYETASELTRAGLGQSTFVGLGGDMVRGTSFVDVLSLFKDDPETHGIVLIGEIGGYQEELAAKYIKENVNKPVVAFIAGRKAKPGRRMGHAGALVMGGVGTYESKVETLKEAGVQVADSPADIARIMARIL
ncbi:MAG: succinyl-CoA synthetase alpha subunit [Clostridia bacterium]|nr:succinyl-CoA synthetase alpha subunit [Clostridia bacterium]